MPASLMNGCSLSIGAFTLGSGCSHHGCGCNYTKNAYMFEEFVFYDNVQFMPSTSVGTGEYMVKGELEVRLRLLRLCIRKVVLLVRSH